MERLCQRNKTNSTCEVIGEGIFLGVKHYGGDDFTDISSETLEDNYEVNSTEDKDKEISIEGTRIGFKSNINSLRIINFNIEDKYLNKCITRNILVYDNDGNEKQIKLITINVGWKKNWCGGYRNQRTKKLYWNAYTQTVFTGDGKLMAWPRQEVETVSRSTQTHLRYISRGVSTLKEKLTQTPLCYEEDYQRLVVPFTLLPREEIENKKSRVKNAILVIQKWVKRFLAMKDFKKHSELAKKFRSLEERKTETEEIQIPDPIKMSIKPAVSSKAQLYNLEREVIRWKRNEIEKIFTSKAGPVKYAALNELLDKEIRFLYQYEGVKIKLKQEQEEKRKDNFLQIIADCNNRKAKDLKDLYELYLNKNKYQERLETIPLLINKLNTEYLDYEWSIELIDLLNREYAMMECGYKDIDLNNLRVRIEDLLFNLVCCPEYNPLHNKYVCKLRRPYFRKKDRVKTNIVTSRLVTKAETVNIPELLDKHTSVWLDSVGKITKNTTPYEQHLKYIIKSENQISTTSWVCNQINAVDVYYLIDIIWNGRSILTERNDLERLRCVRWEFTEEWSPWNCIVVTESEAVLHAEVTDVDQVYSSTLIRRIHLKHISAKLRFSKLYEVYLKHLTCGGSETVPEVTNMLVPYSVKQ